MNSSILWLQEYTGCLRLVDHRIEYNGRGLFNSVDPESYHQASNAHAEVYSHGIEHRQWFGWRNLWVFVGDEGSMCRHRESIRGSQWNGGVKNVRKDWYKEHMDCPCYKHDVCRTARDRSKWSPQERCLTKSIMLPFEMEMWDVVRNADWKILRSRYLICPTRCGNGRLFSV